MLAVSLAMILTAVTHLTLKGPMRPFFPAIFWLTIKHGFFAFGVLVAGAVLWQRSAGTVVVSVPVAVLVLGLIAGLITTAVTYLTTLASLEPSR
jgi:hypothetical protein